jgi:hypothetical protein
MMDVDLSAQPEDPESGFVGTTLSAQQFYQHDPLLRLLKDKWRLNDLVIVVAGMVLAGGLYSVWWLWMGYILAKAHFWGLGDTLSAFLQTFVVFPLLFLIYLLVPNSIASLFNTLRATGVIGEYRRDRRGSKSYEDFLQQVITWTDRSWWVAGALTVVVLYLLYRILVVELWSSSLVPFWLRLTTLIIVSFLMYATFMSVVRVICTVVFTNWLFYIFTIQVKPLQPDGSGGLAALGRILWVSVIMLLWDALLLGAALLESNFNLFSSLEKFLLGAIYVALIPSLFIGWLVLPHRVMVKAREVVLQPLADEFQHTLLEMTPSPKDDANAIKTNTDRLLELKRRYDLVRDTFPTWPLEVQALGRAAAVVILPTLLAILPQVVSFVSQIFFR